MGAAKSLIPSELIDFLLNVAPIRPVFIWEPPGIGKSPLLKPSLILSACPASPCWVLNWYLKT
jgi:hypothetical protein